MKSEHHAAVYVCRQVGTRYGKRCRIVWVAPSEKDRNGRTLMHVGDECVIVQFEDGERVDVLRRQILREEGLQARQILAKVEHSQREERATWIETIG